MPIQIKKLAIPEVLLIETKKIKDERGYFMEIFKSSDYLKAGLPEFVQDNFSTSQYGVLRGLHYQAAPYEQGKLVRCLEGKIWDVAVDIRPKSPTYKQWVAQELSEENAYGLFIPTGFAHGFVVLSPEAKVLYKTTAEYHKPSERGIIWNDPTLGITWPIKEPELSEKDKQFSTISNFYPPAGGPISNQS